LGIVGIDSSGRIKRPYEPVWMAAVRIAEKQRHNILFLDVDKCEQYRKTGPEDFWIERIAASLIFKSLRPLIKTYDIVQIHKDWPEYRVEVIRDYLHRLFGKEFYGRFPLSAAKYLQFIPGDGTDEIQLADGKSWKARHKAIDNVFACPDLSKLLQDLE
jgi:hypothetical protein